MRYRLAILGHHYLYTTAKIRRYALITVSTHDCACPRYVDIATLSIRVATGTGAVAVPKVILPLPTTLSALVVATELAHPARMERVVDIPPIIPLDPIDPIEHGTTLLLKRGNLRRTPALSIDND
jgi:hypothetical protein